MTPRDYSVYFFTAFVVTMLSFMIFDTEYTYLFARHTNEGNLNKKIKTMPHTSPENLTIYLTHSLQSNGIEKIVMTSVNQSIKRGST